MEQGSFIFVLHSHVPFVRKSGKWPHGEEMLFEIIAETYLPLLNALSKLHAEKVDTPISLGLTPVLLEQLADKYMQSEFVKYIQLRIKAVEKDAKELPKIYPGSEEVIVFYRDWLQKTLDDYEHRYKRDIIGAFKYLQDHTQLDILTSAATHGYLPLLARDSAIRGQLKTGIKHYKKYFGRNPTGIWLPECGYRPLNENMRKGIESFLEEANLQYFFTDSHVIENGSTEPNQVLKSYAVADMPNSMTLFNDKFFQSKEKLNREYPNDQQFKYSTFHGYTVGDSNVFVFGRDKLTGMQVWSAQWGYPGDFEYREFHKKAPTSGLQYWKITDKLPGMKNKKIYNPKLALEKAQEHASHFTSIVTEHLAKYKAQSGKAGVIVSSYDTELFGHWWFEGVTWIESVIRNISKQKQIRLISARQYVEEQTEATAVNIPESSWGNGGQHATWYNPDTEYMWPIINRSEHRFETLATKISTPSKEEKEALNQAARELLLLQSSDWPFLITTVQAKDFAQKKFADHQERFEILCEMIESHNIDISVLNKISETDTLFPDINYKDFA